jgi:DNA polymerase type B, organellar and viral
MDTVCSAAHNLSRFDLVFLFKYIASLAQEGEYSVDIIKKDDQVKLIRISNNDKKISITLKDSYLLLPDTLANLANLFLNTNTSGSGKTIEPVFIGDPNSPYYAHNLDTYTKEVELIKDLNEWKSKIKDYCINDSVILYDIIIKFRNLVYGKWEIDINKHPTAPSLGFAIFRQRYLEKGVIPIIKGKVYEFIKESYTGGSTEMYKPAPPKGTKIHCYDVNGLYPSRMKTWEMPVGIIRQFEGDITILDKDKDKYYWIGDARVNSKGNLYQPYLQIPFKTGSGFRTIAPNGNFSMKINSCEYYNALKDYDIQVRSGFLFDNKNIFFDYVVSMYELRLQYPKNHPMNMIAKLLGNSLYGRFALNPILESNVFCSWEDFKLLSEKYDIVDKMDLGELGMFVSFNNPYLSVSGGVQTKSSIAIASAVTAYARVKMSKYKNNLDFELY